MRFFFQKELSPVQSVSFVPRESRARIGDLPIWESAGFSNELTQHLISYQRPERGNALFTLRKRKWKLRETDSSQHIWHLHSQGSEATPGGWNKWKNGKSLKSSDANSPRWVGSACIMLPETTRFALGIPPPKTPRPWETAARPPCLPYKFRGGNLPLQPCGCVSSQVWGSFSS